MARTQSGAPLVRAIKAAYARDGLRAEGVRVASVLEYTEGYNRGGPATLAWWNEAVRVTSRLPGERGRKLYAAAVSGSDTSFAAMGREPTAWDYVGAAASPLTGLATGAADIATSAGRGAVSVATGAAETAEEVASSPVARWTVVGFLVAGLGAAAWVAWKLNKPGG